MRLLGRLLGLLIVVIGLLFAALNAHPVSVHYYFDSWHLPLSLLVLLVLFLGALIGMLATLGFALRQYGRYRGVLRRYQRLKKELAWPEEPSL